MKVEAAQLCVSLNKALVEQKLTLNTWGNVSVTEDKLLYIKPSGVDFDKLTTENIAVIDKDGQQIHGLKPSVDTPIHRVIYQHFPNIRCILHTHSKFATIWCQSRKPIPIIGTTHADYFPTDIPVIDLPSKFDFSNYETNLGRCIVDYFKTNNIDPTIHSAVLLANHGVFLFSTRPEHIIEYAATLEFIAEMALFSTILGIDHIDNNKLFDKHFTRKHGVNKYYGQ